MSEPLPSPWEVMVFRAIAAQKVQIMAKTKKEAENAAIALVTQNASGWIKGDGLITVVKPADQKVTVIMPTGAAVAQARARTPPNGRKRF